MARAINNMSSTTMKTRSMKSKENNGNSLLCDSTPKKSNKRGRIDLQTLVQDLQSIDETIICEALEQIWTPLEEADEEEFYTSQVPNEFYWHGGHKAVFKVMLAYPNCQGIQAHAIRVIANVTYKNSVLVTAFSQVGAIQVILAAMGKFRDNPLLQGNGLVSLTSMTCMDDTNAKALVSNPTGLSTILSTMDVFSNDEDIVVRGCHLVMCLCRLQELWKPILDTTKALVTLVTVGDMHKKNAHVQSCISQVLECAAEYRMAAMYSLQSV